MGRKRSILAAQEATRSERPVGVVQQRDPAIDLPAESDLHTVGTAAAILRYVTAPDGSHHIICQGQQRFRIRNFCQAIPSSSRASIMLRRRKHPAPRSRPVCITSNGKPPRRWS